MDKGPVGDLAVKQCCITYMVKLARNNKKIIFVRLYIISTSTESEYLIRQNIKGSCPRHVCTFKYVEHASKVPYL